MPVRRIILYSLVIGVRPEDFVVADDGRGIPVKVTLTALFAAGFAHIIYPLIKRYLARPRPFEKDLSLIVAAAPLDRYSCPSGHVMTATTVFLPFVSTSLPLASVLLIIWCLLAWARIILGHHYASDLIVGVEKWRGAEYVGFEGSFGFRVLLRRNVHACVRKSWQTMILIERFLTIAFKILYKKAIQVLLNSCAYNVHL